MDFDDVDRLVPFDQLHSPPDEDYSTPGRRATMAVMESPSVFRSPAGFDLLSLSAKKRKRKVDEDSLSIQSLDIPTERSSAGKRLRKSLSRVVSLVNMASPVRPVKKLGGSLQRSLSFKNVLSPSVAKPPSTAQYKKPVATPTKRRPSKLWQETVDGDVSNIFSEMQIRRQNAIYELYQSEEDLVNDLTMVKTLYHDSLKKLGLMTDEELAQVFGVIETLTPLHQDLAERLQAQKQPDGSTDKVGRVLLDWIDGLLSYIPYCANQVFAKDVLDRKRDDKRVQDFLERCRESPFSRKLDLWTFLDVPRSRLVKYPLLFRNIQKRTPSTHEDICLLEEAASAVEEIIHEVDTKTGQAKCNFYKERFHYIDESQRHTIVDNSKTLLLDGILRNNRGTKLTAFLFDKALILTRPTTRHERQCFQVYRYPLALSQLVLEDLKDGEVKMGSFRNMLGQGQGSKHVFRVTWPNQVGKGYTHTLQARDEHDKKQWLNSITDAVEKAKAAKLKEGKSSSPVPVSSEHMKISDDDFDDLIDDNNRDKENSVNLDDVIMITDALVRGRTSEPRKRSLGRRSSDCAPPAKRVSGIGASPMLSTPTGPSRRSLTRAQSSCILTTPNLADQSIPFADDSESPSSEDSSTPAIRRVGAELSNRRRSSGKRTSLSKSATVDNRCVESMNTTPTMRVTRKTSSTSLKSTTPTRNTTPRRLSRQNSAML